MTARSPPIVSPPMPAIADPTAAYREANKLKAAGDLEGACEKLEAIVAEHPDHALSHSALAVHLQRLGRNDQAVTHAKRVTELEPDDPFSYSQLSVVCQRCGLIQEAEDAMAKARMIQMRG